MDSKVLTSELFRSGGVDCRESSHFLEGELREIKLDINFIEIDDDLGVSRSVDLDLLATVGDSRVEHHFLTLGAIFSIQLFWLVQGVINVQEEFSPSRDRIVLVLFWNFASSGVVALATLVHVQETVDVVTLQFVLLLDVFRSPLVQLSSLLDSVLKDEVVDQSQLDLRTFELLLEDDWEEESAVILSELLDSDGRLALISKLMHPARVVGIVFENRQIHLFDSQLTIALILLEEFHSCSIVVMQQWEAPYDRLVVVSSLEDLDAFCVELLVLQLPENLTPVEQVFVENVFGLKVVIDLTVAAWSENVGETFFLGDRLSGSHR